MLALLCEASPPLAMQMKIMQQRSWFGAVVHDNWAEEAQLFSNADRHACSCEGASSPQVSCARVNNVSPVVPHVVVCICRDCNLCGSSARLRSLRRPGAYAVAALACASTCSRTCQNCAGKGAAIGQPAPRVRLRASVHVQVRAHVRDGLLQMLCACICACICINET